MYEWVVAVLAVVGIVSFSGVVIALLVVAHHRAIIKEEIASIGGMFAYEMTYENGRAAVLLRLFEGHEKRTRLSEVLGLAQGLVPYRGPSGWYLRPVAMKGVPKQRRIWEISFIHAKPVDLPMRPEMKLRQRIHKLEKLLEPHVKDSTSIDADEARTMLTTVEAIKRERFEVTQESSEEA